MENGSKRHRERCTCGHHPDDICVEGVIYESCSSEYCYGACSDEGGKCKGGPGCCDPDAWAKWVRLTTVKRIPYRAQFVGGPLDDQVVTFLARPPMVYRVPLRREVTLQAWIEPDPATVMFASIPTFDYQVGGYMAPGVVVYYPIGTFR